jgi:uncharacterized protein DUF5906
MKLNINLNEEKGTDHSKIVKDWQLEEVEINNIEDAREVFCNHAYSPNKWVGGYRTGANFTQATFVVVDYDDGVTINEAKNIFKPYQYIIVTSRNHRKIKSENEDESEIDRFHVILTIKDVIADAEKIKKLKQAKLFDGSDKSVFDAARMIYASPLDAEIYINESGDVLDIDTLEYKENNNGKVELQRKRFFNYPEKVKDAYKKETPLGLFEGRAIKIKDLKDDTVMNSTPKFFCPLGDDCPAGTHNSASSYLVEMEDGSFMIKDFKHPETVIFKVLPLADRCNDWYRVGPHFNEVILLKGDSDVRLTRRGNQDVLTRLGEDAPVYIIKEKSVADPINFDFIGGEGKDLSYQYINDRFIAYAPLPSADIKDNGYIDKFLTDLFAEHADFIRSWIAYYTYSNFLHLPILILTGPRGTGKSLFAEVVGMIYKNLFGRFDTSTNYTEHNGLKMAIIEEADEIDNRKLYSILKDVGGTEKLIKNVKYGPKTIVRNNLNIIVISNNRTPLYLKSKEFPTSEYNNQFFVFNLKPVNGSLNNRLKEEIGRRIGWWLRSEIKDLYIQLQNRNDSELFKCRYQIPVPITTDELLLFENNTTESELAIKEFLDDLKTDYLLVSDLRSLSWKSGISEHQIKRKLVDIGVIESVGSLKDKRNLKGIDGASHPQPRYFRLTSTYKQEVLYKKLIQK